MPRETARRALYRRYPQLRVLRGQGKPLGLDGGAGLLADDGTVVLSYVVSEARAWVFAVTRDPASGQAALKQAAPIEVRAEDLAKRVDAFVRAVSTKDEAAADASRALRTLLLEPVQAALEGAARLVVVPDAFLWAVPFEALQDGARPLLDELLGHVHAVAHGAGGRGRRGITPSGRAGLGGGGQSGAGEGRRGTHRPASHGARRTCLSKMENLRRSSLPSADRETARVLRGIWRYL